jgi:tetratricopeptide (TPR) repeat protein
LVVVFLVLSAAVVALTVRLARSSRPQVAALPDDSGKVTTAEKVLAAARPLLEQQQYAQAISLMEAYVAGEAKDVDIRPILAEALMGAGRYDQAERTVDDVIRLAPLMARALWLKGQLVGRRQAGQAAYFFRQAAESPDASGEIWAGYGQVLLDAGQLTSAEQYLERARQAGLDDARTLGPLGELALRRGRLDEAEALLMEAVRSAKTNPRLWAMLAEAQRSNGKTAIAADTLTNAIEACPEAACSFYMQLGEVLLLLDRHQNAADAFAKAAEAPSLRARASLQAARCYYLLGHYDLAGKYIDQAAALLPGDADVESWKQKIGEARSKRPPQSAPASKPTPQEG